MSTLEVRGIRHDLDTTDAISIASTGDVTFNNDVAVTGDLSVTGTLTGDGSALTGISSYANADALTLFNASGSAPVYACRAWCNFNGTTNTINASGNISSVTDQGLGDYQFNFSTAMPDVNYAWSCSWDGARGQSGWAANPNASPSWHLTTSLRIEWENTYSDSYANADLTTATMMVIR